MPLAIVDAAASELAVDGTHLYWLEMDTFIEEQRFQYVRRCPLSGCLHGEAVELARSSEYMTGLQVDERTLYWIEYTNGADATYSSHHWCPLERCGAQPTSTHPGVHSFAVDASYLYWVQTKLGQFGGLNVRRAPKP